MPNHPLRNPILNESYWRRPEARKHGDRSSPALYQAVGRALSNWERADQEMASLFMVLVGCDDPVTSTAVRRAYGSIESNVGRRNAILAAAEIYFRKHWHIKSIRTSIVEVLEGVSFASKRRDDIAHGIVIDGIRVDGADYGVFLMPPEYNTGRTHAFIDLNDPLGFMRARYRYVADDIESISKKFEKLREVIRNYLLSCCPRNDGSIPLVEYLLQSDSKRS